LAELQTVCVCVCVCVFLDLFSFPQSLDYRRWPGLGLGVRHAWSTKTICCCFGPVFSTLCNKAGPTPSSLSLSLFLIFSHFNAKYVIFMSSRGRCGWLPGPAIQASCADSSRASCVSAKEGPTQRKRGVWGGLLCSGSQLRLVCIVTARQLHKVPPAPQQLACILAEESATQTITMNSLTDGFHKNVKPLRCWSKSLSAVETNFPNATAKRRNASSSDTLCSYLAILHV